MMHAAWPISFAWAGTAKRASEPPPENKIRKPTKAHTSWKIGSAKLTHQEGC